MMKTINSGLETINVKTNFISVIVDKDSFLYDNEYVIRIIIVKQ